MSDVDLWRIQLANGEVRSGTLEQLDAAYQAGVVTHDTLVMGPGQSSWARLGEVADLEDLSGAAPRSPEPPRAAGGRPPPPPLPKHRKAAPPLGAPVPSMTHARGHAADISPTPGSVRSFTSEIPVEELETPRRPLRERLVGWIPASKRRFAAMGVAAAAALAIGFAAFSGLRGKPEPTAAGQPVAVENAKAKGIIRQKPVRQQAKPAATRGADATTLVSIQRGGMADAKVARGAKDAVTKPPAKGAVAAKPGAINAKAAPHPKAAPGAKPLAGDAKVPGKATRAKPGAAKPGVAAKASAAKPGAQTKAMAGAKPNPNAKVGAKPVVNKKISASH